jgi:hypothetical protein
MGSAYNTLVGIGKPEWKRALGIPRCELEDNTGMDHSGIGWEGVDWMHLAQDRDQWRVVVNTVMNLRVLYKTVLLLTS